MPKQKRRTIYAFQTNFYRYDPKAEDNTTEYGWDRDLMVDALTAIKTIPEDNRHLKDNSGDWLMYLDDFRVELVDGGHSPYIRGWFCSARSGLRTELLDINTLARLKNPKKPGQNEIRKTHFYFRLSDGLFLLDNYSDNVAIPNRIAAYIAQHADTIFGKKKIVQLSFEKLLSQGFIDKLNGFERVSLAYLKVKVRSGKKYDTSDAVGHMQEEAKITRSNEVEITLRKNDSRKEGMQIPELANLLKKYISRDEVVSGKIRGIPAAGNPPELRLSGAEEKHPEYFDVDLEGEILTEQMFGFMLKIGDSHPRLTP